MLSFILFVKRTTVILYNASLLHASHHNITMSRRIDVVNKSFVDCHDFAINNLTATKAVCNIYLLILPDFSKL